MRYLTLLTLVIASLPVFAQDEPRGPIPINPNTNVVDGVYVPDEVPTKQLVPYEYVRQADVVWSKRVWRVIDLRERQNRDLYYPLEDYRKQADPNDENAPPTIVYQQNNRRWSLWSVIRHAVLVEKSLTPYYISDPENFNAVIFDGDQFKYPCMNGMSYIPDDSTLQEELKKMFNFIVDNGEIIVQTQPDQFGQTYDSLDDNGELVVVRDIELTPILSKDIVEYEIKEDWFFDKEVSMMKPRIIGLAPVIYKKDPDGNILGKQKLFWIYFSHARNIFNHYYVYNSLNDSRWISFDDLFNKREFESYIVKESNSFDRRIEEYRRGVDALLESEKIKEELFIMEHDLWEF